MYKCFLKRLFDFLVALFGLIVLSPIIVLISIFLSLLNKGTPFFRQFRIGKNESRFTITKFKTMTDEKDENGELLSEKYRLTKFGRFLRKTSLDELPQLYNVLVGDMSFIGPRPLLVEYLPYYTEEERKRHCIRPGITGLAQVNGRNFILWEKRIEYDLMYVNTVSFRTDMQILIKTLISVLRRDDITVDEGEKGRARLHVRRNPLNAGKYDNNGFPIKE